MISGPMLPAGPTPVYEVPEDYLDDGIPPRPEHEIDVFPTLQSAVEFCRKRNRGLQAASTGRCCVISLPLLETLRRMRRRGEDR